jgi:hypothetical protein
MINAPIVHRVFYEFLLMNFCTRTLYYTWRRIAIAEENLRVSQEGQITERFTRAVDQLGDVDQLGNPAIEIRLGGIYALERISTESEKDYWPIMEILTAYVRKNSSFKAIENKTFTAMSMDIQANETIKREVPYVDEIRLDIQAILIVIKRRTFSFNSGESIGLDLQRTHLRKANLREAHLGGADLSRANLEGTNLSRANLEGANLREAHLGRANLREAHLGGADLREANLSNAHLERTHLERANLAWAYLLWANFGGAYFIWANCSVR